VGGWRTLQNVKPPNLYDSAHIIRTIKYKKIRWTGQTARMEEMRNAYNILDAKPKVKRPCGRPWRLGVDRILY
jgi:hypothetical protein